MPPMAEVRGNPLSVHFQPAASATDSQIAYSQWIKTHSEARHREKL